MAGPFGDLFGKDLPYPKFGKPDGPTPDPTQQPYSGSGSLGGLASLLGMFDQGESAPDSRESEQFQRMAQPAKRERQDSSKRPPDIESCQRIKRKDADWQFNGNPDDIEYYDNGKKVKR